MVITYLPYTIVALAIVYNYHRRHGDVVDAEKSHNGESMYTTRYANVTRYTNEIFLCKVRYSNDEFLSRQDKYQFTRCDS